ncbi:MAG: 50S ribosomal protein L15 [Patescibacteria group bacterium]
MTLNLSNLKPAKGSAKKSRRIGRGGKRGSYSGKGMKGQRARSGVSGLKALGFKQTLLRTPKVRGFKSSKPKMSVINLSSLEANFSDSELVDIKKLIQKKLVDKANSGVKILATGKLTKKLTVIATAYSAEAKKAIEAVGGRVQGKQ